MTTLTMKEEKRLEVIQRVFRGELTVAKAALVLGVSGRQCYRIKARVTRRGARGEDPEIRRRYEAELSRHGVPCRMPG